MVSSNECVTATALSNLTRFVISMIVTGDVFPPLQSLFEEVFEIYRKISVLLGSETGKTIIIRHATGTIYQSRLVFSFLE